MQLTMTVSSAQARSLGPEAVARFLLRGGTIGRAHDNDWVLPDPDRIVSGHHARILYEQGTYYIEDTSANGTFLNQIDAPLPKGQPVALDHGATLYIGDYEIRVELVEEPPRVSTGGFDLEKSDLPDAEFVAKPYTPQAGPDRGGERDVGWGREPDHAYIPEEDRYLAPADKFPPQDADGVPVQPNHLAADKQHFRPPEAAPELIPEDIPPPVSEVLPVDWWKTEDESPASIEPPPSRTQPPAPEPKESAAPEDTLLSESAQQPVAQEQPPPAARTPASSPSKPTSTGPRTGELEPPSAADSYRLVEAFFEGLELDPTALSPEESELLMRRTGRLLRLLTQGAIDVLQARSTLKGEFRLSQTIVRPAENNPLKFSLDADQALRQFFVDRRPGFMGMEAAFAEALKDIKQHEIAVVAGMRAAFECLLHKLAPEAVEAALRASGKRPSMLPFGDKEWDFYKSFYADFKASAGDDFQGIFGEDFVRAYEEQIAMLASRKEGL